MDSDFQWKLMKQYYLVKKLEINENAIYVKISSLELKGEKRIADYVECFNKVYELSDYITINISSPNTPDLRDLHSKENIYNLLKSLDSQRQSFNTKKPVFLKISPDESPETLQIILDAVREFNISGLILSNTTIDKSLLQDKSFLNEAGGLSGEPLFNKSTQLVQSIKQLDPSIPIIGVGGVIDKAGYVKKLDAGADLVQIYTGFILKGPDIISELLD